MRRRTCDGLRTGPFNFGFLDNPSLQNWVEHFPYQDGLLVWYYDTSFPDKIRVVGTSAQNNFMQVLVNK